MINLKTNCAECSHEKICRNIGRPESLKKHIENAICGSDFMSDSNYISIDISCTYFEKRVPKRKEI